MLFPRSDPLYDTNTALLKKNHPAIWQLLASSNVEPLGNVCRAVDGKYTLALVDGQGKVVHLHDAASPESETSFFLERIPKDYTGFVAILGMGLGYTPMAILRERPHLQFLAVFELEPGIFLQALRHMDLSPLFSDPRLILSIGEPDKISQVLAPAARTLQLETAQVFCHRQSFLLNRERYGKLKDEVFAHLNSLNVGGATTRALGRDFVTNRFRHVCTIHHHLLLEQLQDAFRNVPAILVAGGPSLDKNIHILRQAQESAVIIAVDTVLPALLRHDIHPHFLSSIDPKNLTYEKFADVIAQAKDISLICPPCVNQKTPKIFPADQVFWTFTAKPLEAWINSLLGGKLFNTGASTVAHLNLIAAHALGCDPIIFIGQDLAYSSKSSHVKDTVLQAIPPSDDLPTISEGDWVKGIDGSILRTDRAFLSMKKHFESIIANTSNTYINATEGGAHLEGTAVLTLQETIDNYCTRQEGVTQKIKDLTAKAPPLPCHKMLAEFRNTLAQVKTIRKDISRSDKLCNTAHRKLAKLRRDGIEIRGFGMLPKQLQQIIHEIDRLNRKLDNTPRLWQLLEEVTMDGLRESERRRQAIGLLTDNPDQYAAWLTMNLDRFLDINQTRKNCLTLLTDGIDRVLSYHNEESRCLESITGDREPDAARLDLVRLYMDSGDYSLALPFAEELHRKMPMSGEILFYLGCIAAERSEHDKEETWFNQALELDPALGPRIENFRRTLADEFWGFVQYFKTQRGRRPSVKYMFRKGLRHFPSHAELLKELDAVTREELQDAQSALAAGRLDKAAPLIRDWQTNLLADARLTGYLAPELVASLFRQMGDFESAEHNFPAAKASFEKAIELMPRDPNLRLMLIDTLFTIGEFSEGIAALEEAIKIDRNCAGYWERIGDSLQAAGQQEDALAAYERCFMHLPHEIVLLRKMGDCYMACGQLEAAREAYGFLKQKMAEN